MSAEIFYKRKIKMPLVNAKEMLTKAKAGHYAVGQFNINNLEWTKSILLTAQELNSPVILGVSEGAGKYMCGYKTVVGMVNGMLEELNITVPVALHLDHGSYEGAKKCIEAGFSSIMFDGSHYPIEENIEKTKELVATCNKLGLSLEAEVGAIGGEEDGVIGMGECADPKECKMVADLGVTMLAAGIGNIHGKYPANWKGLSFETLDAIQQLDGLDEQKEKRYIHHYNFPSYSVGETKPSRGPGRREIGHGALAEKALLPVIPSVDEFPYAIRVVSEVLSSNGSTSQGSVCGSTLALMAAGVPIKAPVAGISCGLITGDEGVYGDFMTMVDIQGLEDFYGDMDFKVAGTKKGITAIQMDLKVHGLTPAIIKEAFAKTHKARNYILDEIMLPVISEPRKELSKWAPKMLTTKIDPDKIGDVIGKQGKVIQKICAECDCKVDVSEDGQVFVSSIDLDNAKKAIFIVDTIANGPEVGAVYKGIVTRLMSFGAFVEIVPGVEGMVHISQLDVKRTEKVEDVVNVGDEIIVKVLPKDEQGRLNLSRREALIEVEGLTPENDLSEENQHRGGRRDFGRRPHRSDRR